MKSNECFYIDCEVLLYVASYNEIFEFVSYNKNNVMKVLFLTNNTIDIFSEMGDGDYNFFNKFIDIKDKAEKDGYNIGDIVTINNKYNFRYEDNCYIISKVGMKLQGEYLVTDFYTSESGYLVTKLKESDRVINVVLFSNKKDILVRKRTTYNNFVNIWNNSYCLEQLGLNHN